MGGKRKKNQYNESVKHWWDSSSPVAESYRIFAINVQMLNKNEAAQSILLTSAEEKEGKSIASANLAIAMAQSNKNSVLVDVNSRRPTSHLIFDLNNTHGVTSYITKDITLDDIIQETAFLNLSVITAGTLPLNSLSLMNADRMKKMLHELKKRFDVVILDGSPVLNGADATILSALVDHCVFLVKEKKTRQKKAIKAKQQLEDVGANVLGIVLNS